MDRERLVYYLEFVRVQLIWAFVILACFTLGAYVIAPAVLQGVLSRAGSAVQLVFLGPAEGFVARLKLAAALALFAYLPIALFQLWLGIRGSLSGSARWFALLIVPIGFGLFAAGAALAYFGVVPIAMRFFLSFRSESLEPLISISSYVSFLIGVALPFGVIFEMPVLFYLLARLGVMNPRVLAGKRKYVILGTFIVAGVLTPPDVLSQIILAVPMLLLYEVSLWVAKAAWKRSGVGRRSAGTSNA